METPHIYIYININVGAYTYLFDKQLGASSFSHLHIYKKHMHTYKIF